MGVGAALMEELAVAKGVAELGICGVAAAVANAVYNATGVDKIITRLPVSQA